MLLLIPTHKEIMNPTLTYKNTRRSSRTTFTERCQSFGKVLHSFLTVLVQSTNTDTGGAEFTCCASTKVQILTPEELREGTLFTCFTSTNVQTLTAYEHKCLRIERCCSSCCGGRATPQLGPTDNLTQTHVQIDSGFRPISPCCFVCTTSCHLTSVLHGIHRGTYPWAWQGCV